MVKSFMGCIAGIDDVVTGSGWDQYREARLDGTSYAVEDHGACPVFDPEELIQLVDFLADLLVGVEGHQHQLTVFGCIEDTAKVVVRLGYFLNDLHKASLDAVE